MKCSVTPKLRPELRITGIPSRYTHSFPECMLINWRINCHIFTNYEVTGNWRGLVPGERLVADLAKVADGRLLGKGFLLEHGPFFQGHCMSTLSMPCVPLWLA